MLPSIINYSPFLEWLQNSDLESWHETLPALIDERLDERRWGDMPGWLMALESLPDISCLLYTSDAADE